MKKLFCLLMVFGLFVVIFGACAEESQVRETLTDGDFLYVLKEDGTAKITGYTGKDSTVTIPSEFNSANWELRADIEKQKSKLESAQDQLGRWIEGGKKSEANIQKQRDKVAKEQAKLDALQELYLANGGDPVSVTAIASDAFRGKNAITSIIIPDSVEYLDSLSFLGCEDLVSVIVSPDHKTLVTIDHVLFRKTDKCLIWYPPNMPDATYSIPNGVRSIDSYAFYASKNLEIVYIPNTVNTIGHNPFLLCEKLSAISVSHGNPSLVDDHGVLYSLDDKRLICYPMGKTETGYSILEQTEIVGSNAFSFCTSLRSITIPDSVNSIGENAFLSCPYLTLTVSRGSYAAQYCSENGLSYTYPDAFDWLND